MENENRKSHRCIIETDHQNWIMWSPKMIYRHFLNLCSYCFHRNESTNYAPAKVLGEWRMKSHGHEFRPLIWDYELQLWYCFHWNRTNLVLMITGNHVKSESNKNQINRKCSRQTPPKHTFDQIWSSHNKICINSRKCHCREWDF